MLDVKVNGSGCRITARGSGVELLAEITLLINDLYSAIYKQDKQMATDFRRELTRAIVDPESPAWNTEICRGKGFMVIMPPKRERGTHDD